MSNQNELMDKIAAKRAELKSVFESNEDGKYSAEQKEEIKSRNDELAELVEDLNIEKKKLQNEKALDEDSKPVAEMPLASNEAEVKTVGQLFTESEAYKNYVGSGVKGVGIFSGGTAVHSGIITSLNFIGAGNTFAVAGGKVDISIAGGGGGAVGTGTDKVFYENDIGVSQSYTITTGKNAMSAGPITLAANVVVTIPNGSVWSVV